jgi:hypothetical protein
LTNLFVGLRPEAPIICPLLIRSADPKFTYWGYGFDENNSRLLELPDSLALSKTHKTVMFTNFGYHNLVNKKASRLFFGSPERLLSDKPAILGTPTGTGDFLCEKSIRNVYDALAVDFDAPEEHLLATTPT